MAVKRVEMDVSSPHSKVEVLRRAPATIRKARNSRTNSKLARDTPGLIRSHSESSVIDLLQLTNTNICNRAIFLAFSLGIWLIVN